VKKKMQQKKRVYTTAIMAFLMFSIVLASMPMANAAGAITLTPTTQTPGATVTVDGTGFGATKAVGIGFGVEVNVINEIMPVTGPFDVGTGPYIGYLSHLPIKPGTYTMSESFSPPYTTFTKMFDDAGNGTLIKASAVSNASIVNATMNYVTSQFTVFTNGIMPNSTREGYRRIVNYTYYQFNVTPAAGVTTFATGTFQAAITVPSAFNGNNQVTAIDTEGHTATALLTVTGGSSVWDKTYGGTGADTGEGDTVQTSDGGYAIAGDTKSFGAGGTDFWLIKTDADGNMQWNKTYGGALDEVSGGMCQTNDGGYAMAGYTKSFGAGGQDFWLVRTGADGNAYWAKTYGGTGDEYAIYVIQSVDGGYAMSGYTNSFGAGGYDAYLVKTDASGNMQWSKTYGGNGTDYGYGVVQTSDGGYAISGYTTSFGTGGQDFWLIKTDASGNMQWNKTYGGTGTDAAMCLIQSVDGGYALVGYTSSFGAGSSDFWLVKTDAAGNMQWNKTYGTTTNEFAIHGMQTADGGYAMIGITMANGQDFLLVKTDSYGNLQWNMTYGGTGAENGYALLQTSDGGYVLTGNTNSFGAGGNDVWLVKTDPLGVFPEGLTIGVMMLLATVAVIVSTRYFRKQPKI
jgi:predicted secreted protein